MRVCRQNLKPATNRRKFVLLYYLLQNFYEAVWLVTITIDYTVNEINKMLARHIARGFADLSKLCCNGWKIDHHSQFQHDCLLPDDILIDMHFGEAMEKVNSLNVVSRDWLTLLLEVDLTKSDVVHEQLDVIKSWLEESPSERWRHNVKHMVLAAFEDDL